MRLKLHTLFTLLIESIWSPISFRRFRRAALRNSLRSSSCLTAAAAALRAEREIKLLSQKQNK